MARVIHTEEAITAKEVGVLYTYNECPEHPGLTIRYGSLGSCILMGAFIFKDTRKVLRLMKDDERRTYQAERAALMVGSGI